MTFLFSLHLFANDALVVQTTPEITSRIGGIYKITFNTHYPDFQGVNRLILINTERPGGIVAAWYATGPQWTKAFAFSHLMLVPQSQSIQILGQAEFASTGMSNTFTFVMNQTTQTLQGIWEDTHHLGSVAFQGELIDSFDQMSQSILQDQTPRPATPLHPESLSGLYQIQFEGPAAALRGTLNLQIRSPKIVGASLILRAPLDYIEFQSGQYSTLAGTPLITITAEYGDFGLDYNQWMILGSPQKDDQGRPIWKGIGLSTQTGRSIHFIMVPQDHQLSTQNSGALP